ncbi:MAG: NAD(P)-dependent oxidoreductase [Clostridia bacterium]|nr:NAD(P)-dependent oxidoreductase [Clostridia bacterium]
MDDLNLAKQEVNRCIGCVNKPCKNGCPLGNDITSVIQLTKEGKYKEAYELLCETTVLSSACGRICPHERQCQGHCTRRFKEEAVNIGAIETMLGDMAIENDWEIPQISNDLYGKQIAIVGSGPASLTCAAFLARQGAYVVMYERHNKLGGLLRYGIPHFRLNKDLLEIMIEKILDTGINVFLGMELENDFPFESLKKQYDAIFLGFGANISKRMNIPGEDLKGVVGANEFLEYGDYVDFTGKNVFISGGGNVAIDAARTAKRLGAQNVTIVYRRSEEDMPAERKEINDAKDDGVNFVFHTNVIGLIPDESGTKLWKIECVKTEYEDTEEELTGRNRKVVNIKDTNFKYYADYFIEAIGSKPESELLGKLHLKLDKWGNIAVNENHQTSDEKVFAGGDLVGEEATVAWAARSGRDAAESIKKYLSRT